MWLRLLTFYLGLPKNSLRRQPWHHCETNSHQSDHDNGNDQVPSTLENHPLRATTLKCQNVYFKVLQLEPPTSNHDSLLTETFFWVDDVVYFLPPKGLIDGCQVALPAQVKQCNNAQALITQCLFLFFFITRVFSWYLKVVLCTRQLNIFKAVLLMACSACTVTQKLLTIISL